MRNLIIQKNFIGVQLCYGVSYSFWITIKISNKVDFLSVDGKVDDSLINKFRNKEHKVSAHCKVEDLVKISGSGSVCHAYLGV